MILPVTNRDYYLLVNKEELQKRARELGYDNVILLSDKGLTDDDIQEIKTSGKAITMNLFPYPSIFEDNLYTLLKQAKINCARSQYMTYDNDDIEWWDNAETNNVEEALHRMPSPTDLEDLLCFRRIIKRTSYKNHCGNCREYMDDNAKFCKYCGFRRGSGSFEPFYEDARIAYGPPTESKYICSSCGNNWVESGFQWEEPKFCPSCGKKAIDCLGTKFIDWPE